MTKTIIPTREQIKYNWRDGLATCHQCAKTTSRNNLLIDKCNACGGYVCRACAEKLKHTRQDCAVCRAFNARVKFYSGSWAK